MPEKSIFTQAVHAGEDLTKNHGAVSVPIYSASVFAFSDADEGAAIHNYQKKGFFYGKLGNPTQDALECAISELENGESALAFASGMAAISASILTLVKSGDHIVAPESMYSTTSIFLNELNEKFGIETTFVDATTAENYANSTQPNTKIFWIETPSNPLLKITDFSIVAKIAKEKGITTIADNTFATPFNQKPLDFGVDVVIHSATKYLGGHSDLTAGIMVGRKEIVEKARLHTTKLYGGNIAPQIAWLVLRGIKTLALRMERHNQNAFVIADMLSNHSKIKAVFYPGLEQHKNYKIAKKQMKGYGGMIAFDVGGVEEGKRFVNNVKVCTLATSLGGVETILQHSASMTHATIQRERRLKTGITDGLIRLSVGIEDAKDLLEDLQNALEKI
ncbi:MAG: PLP-dependent aspartate aminotransferase family protein [Acidobacteria bacterium]|nr:PLP-dependent aspartate aminotransferase family protein [Acidobacteriota bacterium]MCA1638278.1 PLP-dependent aspartate aminotransferase family protein [Acidobacteriota bacterium]